MLALASNCIACPLQLTDNGKVQLESDELQKAEPIHVCEKCHLEDVASAMLLALSEPSLPGIMTSESTRSYSGFVRSLSRRSASAPFVQVVTASADGVCMLSDIALGARVGTCQTSLAFVLTPF